jgi:3-deoxy-7-phosphoheptulonate synthase
VLAAAAPHSFMGMTKMGVAAIFETRGNADGHVILRGGRAPNFDAGHIEAACAVLRRAGLREQVMVDCSHANSAKLPRRQIEVAADAARQIAGGERRLVGVMVESHLHEGRQDLRPGQPLAAGVSITDACIGWHDTEPLLRALAEAVRARRSLR